MNNKNKKKNMDLDGRALEAEATPASGEAPFTYPHLNTAARGRGTFFSPFGAGRLDRFYQRVVLVHYRILYAGDSRWMMHGPISS